MTSEERKKARYIRRVAKRNAKRNAAVRDADNYDKVFTYGNLYRSYKCCRRGVSWKSSVQRYICQAPANVFHAYASLKRGTYRSPGFFEFDLFERGKKRHIRSTVIGERVVQRCLCDNALVPVLGRSFIYDNGASLKNKGYDFAVKRLCLHLREHIRKHGTNGYIMLFDFTKFFDTVNHENLFDVLNKAFNDERLKALACHFVDMFGNVGLGLGSQISQVLALASANRLDHYVKEVLRIRGYGRYMDDGYLIHPSKAYLKKCLDGIRMMCRKLGIRLNKKKTHIVKLSHGFTWLKIRILINEKGGVVKKICKQSIARMRRKMKRLVRHVDSGRMSFLDVYHSFQSWKSYALRFSSWHTIQNAEKLFDDLYFKEMFT